MKIIDLPQGGGKTTALVKIMLEPGNEDVIYVAPTNAQALTVAYPLALQVAGEGALNVPGRARFRATGRDLRDARVVVDEADGALHGLGPVREIVAIALTSDKRKESAA